MKYNNIIKILILLMFILAVNIISLADAGVESPFLRILPTARALSLGGAFVSLADDGSGFFWNPAGITQIEQKRLTSLYTPLYVSGAQNVSLSYIHSLPRIGNIGLGTQIVRVSDIEKRDEYNQPHGMAKYDQSAIYMCYGRTLPWYNISAGANIKLFYTSIEDKTDYGLGFDLGFLYRPKDELYYQAKYFIEKIDIQTKELITKRLQKVEELVKEKKKYEAVKICIELFEINPNNPKIREFIKLLSQDKNNIVDNEITENLQIYYDNAKRYLRTNRIIEAFSELGKIESIRPLTSQENNFKQKCEKTYKPTSDYIKEVYNKAIDYFYNGDLYYAKNMFIRIRNYYYQSHYKNRFSAGINLQNIIQPGIKLILIEDKIPFNLKAGISYRLLNDNIIVTFDINKTLNRGLKPHFGIEYISPYNFKTRAGFDEKISNVTFGFGYTFKWITFDYSLGLKDLGLNHRVSLSLRFGYHKKDLATEHFFRGMLLYEDNRYRDAINQWRKSLYYDPTFIVAKEYQDKALEAIDKKVKEPLIAAKKLFEEKQYQKAKKKFDEVLRLDSEYKAALDYKSKIDNNIKNLIKSNHQQAQDMIIEGQIIKAIELWEEIIRYNKFDEEALNNIKTYREKLQTEEGERLAEKYYNEGVRLFTLNNWKQAKQNFEKLFQIRKTYKDAQEYYNQVIENLNKIKIAARKREKAQEIYKIGEELYRSDRYRDALNEWYKASDIDKSYEKVKIRIREVTKELNSITSPLIEQGQELLNNKQYSKAIVTFERVLEYDEEHTDAKLWIKKVNQRRNQEVEFFLSQGDKLLKNRAYNKAINQYRQVLNIEPTHTAVLEKIKEVKIELSELISKYDKEAHRLLNEKKYKEAIKQWQSLLKYEPKNRSAKQSILSAKKNLSQEIRNIIVQGLEQFNLKEYNKALMILRKGLDFDDTNDTLLNTIVRVKTKRKTEIDNLLALGNDQFEEGNLIEAINIWKRIEKIDTDNFEARERITNAQNQFAKYIQLYKNTALDYEQDQKYLVAIDEYYKILKLDPDNTMAKSNITKLQKLLSDKIMDLLTEGKKLYQAKNYIAAEKIFQDIIKINNNYITAKEYISKIQKEYEKNVKLYKDLANKYVKSYQYNNAISELRKALIYPNHKNEITQEINRIKDLKEEKVLALFKEGMDHYVEQDFNNARNVWNQALKIDTDNQQILEYIDKADKQVEQLVKLYRTQYEEFYRQELYFKAVGVLQQASTLKPDDTTMKQKLSGLKKLLEKELDQKFQQAYEFYNQKEYQKADKILDEILGVDATYVNAIKYKDLIKQEIAKAEKKRVEDLLFQKGLEYFKKKNFELAVQTWTELYKKNSEYPELDTRLQAAKDEIAKLQQQRKIANKFKEGSKMFQKNQFNQAIKIWEEILQIDPDYTIIKRYIAKAKKRKKRIIEKYLDEGREFLTTNEIVAAIEVYRKLLDLEPDNQRAKIELKNTEKKRDELIRETISTARQVYREGKLDESIEKWEYVVHLDPGQQVAQDKLDELYIERDRRKQAMQLVALGDEAYEQERLSEAVVQWREALELYPRLQGINIKISQANKKLSANIDEPLSKGITFYKKKDYAKAMAQLSLVLSIVPDHDEAKKYYNDAATKIKTTISKNERLAEKFMQSKNYAKSIKLYKEILSLDSKRNDIRIKLRRAQQVYNKYLEQKRKENAEKVKKLLSEGVNLFRNEKLYEAKAKWDEVINLDPDNKKAQDYLKRVNKRIKILEEYK